MDKILRYVFSILLLSSVNIFASEHGIYLRTNLNINSDIEAISNRIISSLDKYGFRLLKSKPMYTPNYVRQDTADHCGYTSQLIILSSDEFIEMLTSFGSKYLVAGFLKIGIYENEKGINVCITDPETINRIVFNDLYENDQEELYDEMINKTKKYKSNIIKMLHNSAGGEKVEQIMEPIRDDEDLAESSRDMFMMVGPLTLFNDEDQFPIIYSLKNVDGFSGLEALKSEFIDNLKSYTPTEDDIEYRWYPNENDLKWEIVSEIVSPKQDAILLGLSRPRTEAVSFNIAGSSREEDSNMCPGIDHTCAYPIEVLII